MLGYKDKEIKTFELVAKTKFVCVHYSLCKSSMIQAGKSCAMSTQHVVKHHMYPDSKPVLLLYLYLF